MVNHEEVGCEWYSFYDKLVMKARMKFCKLLPTCYANILCRRSSGTGRLLLYAPFGNIQMLCHMISSEPLPGRNKSVIRIYFRHMPVIWFDFFPGLDYNGEVQEVNDMGFETYFPIWDQLTAAQQDRITGSLIARQAKKGTVVHRGGMECTGVLLVKEGQLRAYSLSNDGREITLYRLFDRDLCLFSAPCMMRSIQFDITFEAEKDTVYWGIPAEIYRQVMEQSAPLANFTNEIMATRFSEVMWLMEQILWKRFDQRLAGFLLEEANIEGTNVLRITQETIGKHMGNPREVVTRMLKYFSGEGYVTLSRGTVTLCNIDKLREIAEAK